MNTEHWFKTQGRLLRLTNLDKVIYPASSFTKRDVLKYYQAIAPFLLPHLRGRAVTLKRYPEGAEGDPFYEKRCPSHRPPWIGTLERGGIPYCAIDSLPALIWAANLDALELHPVLASEVDGANAGEMVFDLDPGPGARFCDCARVALLLARLLEERSLMSFVKASGSKGLQVHVPLHSGVTFERTRDFSHALARRVERLLPSLVVTSMRKSLRTERIYIDWAQNDFSKSTVAVYSLRGTPTPSVSLPLTWDEVRRIEGRPEASPRFAPEETLARVRRVGDLFALVPLKIQKLPLSP